MLKIFYQNVRGLRTKTTDLKRSLAQSNDDVVCMTETWLNNGFSNVEFCDCDMAVYRRDRNYSASQSERGGGVIITVRNQLVSERLLDFESDLDRLEDIWVRVKLMDNRWLYLCNVYISPFHGNDYLYETFLENVMRNSTRIGDSDELAIMGDLNCPEISGYFSGGSPTLCFGSSATRILNATSFCNLSQLNNVSYSTDEFIILDLVLATLHSVRIDVSNAVEPLVRPDAYHPPLSISVHGIATARNVNPFTLNFRKANYDRINQDLLAQDWELLNTLNTNEAVQMMYSTINSYTYLNQKPARNIPHGSLRN